MQDNLRTDNGKGSVPTSRSEVGLQTQPDPRALRPDAPDSIEVPQQFRPEETRPSRVREKAMPASAPGSEYWLP